MSWTKRQFITASFEELGLASYIFDLGAEQLQSALRKLDMMMATWNAKGIRLGYPISSSPTSGDLDEDTTVPDSSNEAIILGLAIRLAPSFGKVVSQDTKQSFYLAYQGLLSQYAKPIEMQITGLPSGAGNKSCSLNYDTFLDEPQETLDVGDDATLDFY